MASRDFTLSLFNFEQSFETKFYFVFPKTLEMTPGKLIKLQKTKIRKKKVKGKSNKVYLTKLNFVFPKNTLNDLLKTLEPLKNLGGMIKV